jgi:hypothetical protein
MKNVILFDSGSENFLRDCIGLDELKKDEKGKFAYYREDEVLVEVESWAELLELVDRDDVLDFD